MNARTFVSQGWDPAQAAILAAMQPVIDAELARSATATKLSPEVQSLSDLVALYEQKWPEICYVKGGSRARKAMDIVLRGDIVGMSPRDNHDVWLVAGYLCSKAGNWCDCKDMAAPVLPHYGKLCCHRLAVALKTNWYGDKNPALLAYLQPILDAAPGPFVDLLVERDYDYHGEGNRARVAGYWHHGMSQHDRLVPSQIVPVTLPQFQWAMEQVGWALAELPIKLPGDTDYYYRIAPRSGDGFILTESIFWHRGRTARMEMREQMRRFLLIELAAHLKEWINAPIHIELSNYEAKRVTEIRYRMGHESVQAAEVWAALPESLQNVILDNGGIRYAN